MSSPTAQQLSQTTSPGAATLSQHTTPTTDGTTVNVENAALEPPKVVPEAAHFYSGGLRLAAAVYRGVGEPANGLRPGVVLCNGMRGVKEWILPPFGEVFAANGYTAVAFDHRGMGSSDGVPGRVIPAEQVEDVRSAITFLAEQPDVDPDRIVLWGTSFGGAHAIVAAAQDPRVKAVATQVAFGDWGRVMRETLPAERYDTLVEEFTADRAKRVATGESGLISPDRMLDNPESRAAKARSAQDIGERPELMFTLESVERCFEYQPERAAADVSPRPLLIVGSAADGVIPFSECQSLYDLAQEPKKLVGLDIGHYDICEPPGCIEAAQIALEFLAPVVAAEGGQA
jgi:pimeloyl-ACP methyl ester carboxylesterase